MTIWPSRPRYHRPSGPAETLGSTTASLGPGGTSQSITPGGEALRDQLTPSADDEVTTSWVRRAGFPSPSTSCIHAATIRPERESSPRLTSPSRPSLWHTGPTVYGVPDTGCRGKSAAALAGITANSTASTTST